jgi:L-Lysine epsilon oxidase N-terminal/L-lysine epsilon oxidase C-terminal domain
MATTTYEIHPAIGIARLGSSPLSTEEGYFLGPEPGGTPPATYRDPAGYLKRQAARFRIFVCRRDDSGTLLEAHVLVLDEVRNMSWTVHLANRKGTARRQFGSGPGFRNQMTGDDYPEVVIDPGPRSVDMPGARQVFDSGRFRSTSVTLGELIMELEGGLRVLGGFGRSGSDPPQPRLTLGRGHFADNKNWFDDTSDGPVTATITLIDGTVVESQAWVIVGPPDFAPGVVNLVTLYDLIFELAVSRGLRSSPADRPGLLSFTRHVRPILERAAGYRWVNRYARFGYDAQSLAHGFGANADLPGFWAAWADPSPAAQPLRIRLIERLRNPDPRGPQPQTHAWALMPRITDAVSRRTDPGNVLPLTSSQYKILTKWAAGDFVNDLDQVLEDDELLVDALDRVALERCVGGPLYPGIEANRVVLTDAARFLAGEPFRLSHVAVRPGEVTQSNAVPWQADFLVCRWEEFDGKRLRRLAWWPAQRPDDVFPSSEATDMVPWARGIGDEYQDMMDKWDRLGVVIDRGTPGAPFLTETERDTQELGP